MQCINSRWLWIFQHAFSYHKAGTSRVFFLAGLKDKL